MDKFERNVEGKSKDSLENRQKYVYMCAYVARLGKCCYYF